MLELELNVKFFGIFFVFLWCFLVGRWAACPLLPALVLFGPG